jgi:hypothetical protein
MNPVVRRIAIHAAVSAVILGVFGLLLVQAASIWLASTDPGLRPGEKVVSADVDDAFLAALRWRVPMFVACGVVFVVACEIATHYWGKRKGATPARPQPDETEKLLEQLLTQAESVRGTSPQEPAAENQPQSAAQPPPHPESSPVAK